MKKVSKSQLIGQQGELLAGQRALAMEFTFDARNRLETGVDGFLELRDPHTGQMLAKWIGAQVKTTESGLYSREDGDSFEYLLRPEDLEYWREANIPIIIILVRLNPEDIYWKSVKAGVLSEPRRLHFDKAKDKFDRQAADSIAALCVERDRLGSYVPPMQSGEGVHLAMVRAILPKKIFVGASLFQSGRDAIRELVKVDPHAPFDWVIRSRQFTSFRDPRGGALEEIVDAGSVEEVETESIGLSDEADEEHAFIDLLKRTLTTQLSDKLSYDKETHALFFRAQKQNRGMKYQYRSLINETSAEVVSVWTRKDGRVGSIRHHAFVPRFVRINDEWLLSITPTFVFTHDGFRPHYNSGALISGKKKKEKNAALKGQFIMWRHLLVTSGSSNIVLLTDQAPLLQFEPLQPIQMPLAVPEEAWRRDDPNAEAMLDTEWLL